MDITRISHSASRNQHKSLVDQTPPDQMTFHPSTGELSIHALSRQHTYIVRIAPAELEEILRLITAIRP